MKPLLTKKNVAELLQVSTKQVQRLIAEKKIQAQRFGHRTLRIREEEVERYLRRTSA